MNGSVADESQQLNQVKELAWRLYGLHAAGSLLGVSGKLTQDAADRGTAADSEIRAALASLDAAVIAVPDVLGGKQLWVTYRGNVISREGEVSYRDRWQTHLLYPDQPMVPLD